MVFAPIGQWKTVHVFYEVFFSPVDGRSGALDDGPSVSEGRCLRTCGFTRTSICGISLGFSDSRFSYFELYVQRTTNYRTTVSGFINFRTTYNVFFGL